MWRVRGDDRGLTGESGGVLLEQSQLVAQLEHGLGDDGLLGLVLGLEVGERHLGRVLVGLEHGAQRGDLLALGGQQRLELDHLLLQLGQLGAALLRLHHCALHSS